MLRHMCKFKSLSHMHMNARITFALLLIFSCFQGCNYVPGNSSCPPIPGPAVSLSPAVQSLNSSVNIDLSQRYIREKVRQLVQTPHTAQNGVDVGTIVLSEQNLQGQKLNLINIVIYPWLKGSGDSIVSLQRAYELKLKIVPYLITPNELSDESQRTALLCPNGGNCNGTSGILLAFEFYELFSKTYQSSVVCGSSNYDLIDAQVLKAVFASMSSAKPITLPATPILSIVENLTGSPVNLTGVAIGSDLEMKVGILLDAGTPKPFSSQVWLSHFPEEDWGVSIDTFFVAEAVKKSAASLASADPRVVVNNVKVDFSTAGFGISANGKINVCGGINFTATTTAKPQICMGADGISQLQICTNKAQTNPQINILQAACYLGSQILGSFSGGMSTAVIKQGGICPSMAKLTFQAGANDTFYGTKVDTDGVFYLTGRSTFIDSQLQNIGTPRQPLPTVCP